MDNLVEIFFKAAAEFPDHKAILHKSESISYGKLAREVKSTAGYFEKKGIRKGSRVLVFIPMSIKLYKTVLALFSMGAVVVFVDEWSKIDRLKSALKVVEVDAIIAPKRFLWLAFLVNPFRQIRKKISLPNKLDSLDHKVEVVDPDDTALITFTTGSTGVPKAADRTHGFLREQFRILKDEIGARPEDQCLVTLPIVLLSILGTGASGIVAEFNQKKPDLLDLEKQLEILRKKQVSIIVASPFYLEKLSSSEIKPSNIKKVITGGAPVFPDIAKKISQFFSNAECIVAYGSTEAEPISSIKMEDVHISSSGLCVGRLHQEIECKIVKIQDQAISLEEQTWQEISSDFGEIVVSGPHVLRNYYNSDKAFERNKIVSDGIIWHRTGDSGRMLGDKLYLSGRINQLQEKNGEFRSLFLDEYMLKNIQGIKIATLVDDVLCVELDENHDEDYIHKAISDLNLSYSDIRFFANIPRDQRHHSKIDYKSLRKLI